MNSVPAIQIENLAKMYLIGRDNSASYSTVRENIADRAQNIAKLLTGRARSNSGRTEEFWALRDISLEVSQGEIVGFIGKNGAGKSTLLKVLSRITEPTTGRVVLGGRVASLLEVGTGFHPELTGRENVYLNGAILGMTRREIQSKFDEIVSFAEVERFLDTPVKRYSSGMYVRLAFAVAAHLDPEILIVDEVLAVGDAAFQKKCLGKMGDVANTEGRTVLFVSHNMAAVRSLCTEVHLLEEGHLKASGKPDDVVDAYLKSAAAEPAESQAIRLRTDRSGDGSAKIVSARVEDADGGAFITELSRLRLILDYESATELRNCQVSATVYDHQSDVGLISLNSEATGGLLDTLPRHGQLVCETEPLLLTPGRCHINLSLLKGGVMADYVRSAVSFEVEETDVYGTGRTPDRDWAMCIRRHEWSAHDSHA